MNYAYILFLILPIVFIFALVKYRQSLMPGLLFVLNIFNFGLFLVFIYVQNKDFIAINRWASILTIATSIVIALVLLIFPVFLIINFIYNGKEAIKKEGFTFKNLLSILLAVGIVCYIILWPAFGKGFIDSMTSIVYNYIGVIVGYFLIIASAYFFSSSFNNYKIRNVKADYIVVLGAGLMGDKLTPLLKGRVDAGIRSYRLNKGAKLIMSGGQGPDEEVAEAYAMSRYAMDMGVPRQDILVEDKSTSTQENLSFSMKLTKKKKPKMVIVSNTYHIFRALLMANELGIRAKGQGNKTLAYFATNAFIREIVGYISLERKKHTLIVSILSVVYLFIVLVSIIVSKGGGL